ncbi:hypothetical protein TB2_021748 [Malus domestica]
MSIPRARQFPLFLLLISTLFLASSSVNDHDQECQQSICRGIFRNSLKSRQEEDPRTEYFYCWQSCQTSEDAEECEAACRERLDEQLEKQSQKEQGGEDQDEKPTSNPNPYYFPKSTLLDRFGAEEGGYVVLNSLTRLSPFLRGRIKNYRLALFLTAPGTFVLPYHIDAESAFVVSAGKGTLTFVVKNKKESFKIEEGDVIRVPGGATTYLINDHSSEHLGLVQLIRPVNIPDLFEEFFPGGYKIRDREDYSISDDVESYYSVFSNDILEAAFNTPREQLQKALGQQRPEGMIIKASKEQLKALSKQDTSWWRKLVPWWSSEDTDLKFNLQSQKPLHSNNYGKFYEASPQEFKQLLDVNVSVVIVEINSETMMVPHYNSKATYLMMVVSGTGWFEMASPQFTLPESEEEIEYQEDQGEQSGMYTKVSGKLSLGDVFVVPAGRPVVFVSRNNDEGNNQNQNLRIVGFGINAPNNIRNFLAGQEDNIMKMMESEAKQLTFGKEMEQLLSNQKQSYFVPLSTQKSEEGRNHSSPDWLQFNTKQ